MQRYIGSCRRVKLVNFYIGINFPHEYVRSNVADRAADDAERTGEQRHVAEVERRLEKAVHFGFEEEIIERIDIDVDRRGSRRHEAGPLPSVVFGVEQKVCAYDCHAHGHYDQNQEHQQHETVHVVDLVRPERGEDEVHLNEDRSEG